MNSPVPDWIPRSVFGAVLASIYAVLAIGIVVAERAPGGGGGWISLKGIASFLATFPASAVAELAGMKLDFRRNIDMAFAISACTALIYLVGAGLGKLTQLIFANGGGS